MSDDDDTTDLYELEPGMGTSSLDPDAKRTMRVVQGKFGEKKEEEKQEITTSEFLSAFAIKALAHEEEGRSIKVAVIMYEDGEMFEVASNEQYPDGVYMLLQMAAQAIMNETLGVTE
jgi:predicted lipid-binding transport protein (Tim44 family)